MRMRCVGIISDGRIIFTDSILAAYTVYRGFQCLASVCPLWFWKLRLIHRCTAMLTWHWNASSWYPVDYPLLWRCGERSLRVLDRLYYKGKNQHRTSLFWRHVEEMRRFCLRIDSLDLLGILNRLRHSFYDSTSYDKWVFYFFKFVCDDNNLYASSQNILKGSWTHTPQAGDLRTTTRTFTPICQLLLRVRSPHSGYLSINWGVLMSHRLVKDSRVPIGS